MTLFKAAESMGVSKRYAIMKRLAYIQPIIKTHEKEIWVLSKDAERNKDELEKALICARIKEIEKELQPLKRESKLLLNNINGKQEQHSSNGINDEMIDQARQYPITSIIDFNGRKTVCCPFHKDTNPSMSLYDNHAHCFVCNRSWDSISAKMELEGLSFRETVLLLQ